MNISTTYLLNVALHAAVLSVFASLVLMALRHARHRSVAAIAGLPQPLRKLKRSTKPPRCRHGPW
jgi:hypothetical protein